MPGTTRYSATFDRTYEEDDRVDPTPPTITRRSRSQSWQAHSGLDGRPYTPLGGRPPAQRSSSTDSGPSKIPEHIPTRTVANTAVKAHNNPFQFVKVGSCPLYKKAEELLKKTKEVKKQDVLKEEEEDWQSNLDSWKSRRRKMSEDVFRRQEEIKQFEMEEQSAQVSQKKTKTFSEMVEQRAHRGRTLSLCLLSSPLEFQDWEFENKSYKNGSCSTFTDESEENSNVNSEDEGVSLRGRPGRPTHHDNLNNHRTNGDAHIEQNGSKLETHNGDYNKLADLTANSVQMKPKEGSYIDSGLESISSSHRAGDTPDSGSDFSQDSTSSIDCDSPRTGVNLLEEFGSKSLQMLSGQELNVKLSLADKAKEFGFTFQGGKDAGQVLIASLSKGSKAESSGIQLGDQIVSINGTDVSSKKHTEITSMVQKGREKGEISMLLWRHSKPTNGFNSDKKLDESPVKPNKAVKQNAKSESQQHEKSIESENEMYVDDFEELRRQSELLTSSNKSETTCTNSQAHSNGNISPSSLSSNKDSVKTSPAPKLKENISNGAVDEQNKNEKTDSELSTENQKKNVVKVKRVRKKGVYALDVSGIPNPIPQEGIPVNFLYPLSPVSELPSPADETKSMASTLSSNPTTPIANTQNLLRETVKEADAKLNSAIKENNKTTSTASKSVISKTAIPPLDLKNISSDKVESKTDSIKVPSSPTTPKNKNISLESSLEEKPKVPTSPKKVKVVKVKKANTSEQKSSESSQVSKETPSSPITPTFDLSVKKLPTVNQSKEEQTSGSLIEEKQGNENKNEHVDSSQKRESKTLSTETSTVTSDTKSSALKNISTSGTSIPSDKLSVKIDVKNESVSLPSSSKQPKTPIDEKSKPPFAVKKEKAKLMENNVSSAEIATDVSDAKCTNLKDKSVNNNNETSSENLSLKISAQNQSVNLPTTPPLPANTKQPKTPVDEKSKPPFSQKKEKLKSKAKTPEQIPSDLPQVVKELPSSPVSCTSPITNVIKEKQTKKEENLTSITEDKGTKVVNKNEISESAVKRENIAGIVSATPEAKATFSKGKSTVASAVASFEKTKNLSQKIETQNESVNMATVPSVAHNKQPKTPQGEKAKPSFVQKKENTKSKEGGALPSETAENVQVKTTESQVKTPSDKTKTLSLKIDVQNESMNLATPSPVLNSKLSKTPQDEKAKPSFVQKKENTKSKENSDLSPGAIAILPEVKSTGTKVKTLATNTISSDKGRNLSLNIDEQNESGTLATSPVVTNSKPPKTPQDEKKKPCFARKRERSKSKDKTAEKIPSDSSQVLKEASATSAALTLHGNNLAKESKPQKEHNSISHSMPVNVLTNDDKRESSQGNNILSGETPTLTSDSKTAAATDKNISLKIDTNLDSGNVSTFAKQSKIPQEEKSKPFAQKKGKTKSKENSTSSAGSTTVIPDVKPASTDKIATVDTSTASDKTRNLTPKIEAQNQSVNIPAVPLVANTRQPQTPADEKLKPPFSQKEENTKSKNTNSQKVNSSAKQNEELTNSNIDSLNIVFQSEPKNALSQNETINVKNSESNSNTKPATGLVPDIPPVEKVAEEMEKLILEQLEEEERAKELASELQIKNTVGSPEHLLIAPPRLAEPPKEKPPPPPSTNEGNQKDSSLKRVNSTKRIKKEIHKRRSNFLGIDNADESIACSESSIPPPPALEEILKAEMELDRQSRLKIESASTERLTMEENEIMQKEREIIESIESEERQKQLLNGTEDFKSVTPTTPSEVVFEEDRILSLKNERKRIETERLLTEEQQQLHLLDEKQLREREEFIRKQETGKSAGPHSDPSLSITASASNTSKPALSSLTQTKSKVSLSSTNGDGENVTANSSAEISENKSSECDEKDKALEKPAVPPKPLKKKEAIRKERERLRQEQEALQREREEHRRKLMLEQEELMKHQKSHAPDAPVSRLGPLPPLVPPNFPSQLTTTMNATPNARESASFPSRSHHGASNGAAGSINAVELMGPPVVRQNRLPASRKAVQNEAWGQQKMPSVRKQNHDSLTESRYNQNHWLIQEAEMRRITELKERQQRATQLPCSQTHLAEDDVCSNPPRVPVIPPTHNPHLNYAVQDKMWNYGQSNVPPKKYPPPVTKDPVYPRETVSQQPPTKPSRVVPMERQEQMLSVSGRKRCSHCNEELGRGAAMIIESLQLYYHIHCFQCCVCQAQLGNGSCGTDVRVRNNKLHCHNCYSNDEAGLKFSQV